MKNEEKASISIMKIICVSIILVLISGIGVMAVSTNLKDVKIVLQNGYELTVLTAKPTVEEILEENVTEEGVETTLDELLNNYAPITEKIVTEQVEIPFETITRNNAGTSTGTTNKVVQQGKNGLKEVTYKIKYQNEVEIEKIQLSETIIRQPVNKIVNVNKNVTSRSSALTRTTPSTTANANVNGQIYKITAYCPCAKCCGKATGRTAMGTKATAGRTIAASGKFAFGTKLNINGHTYTVEDRGGAIQGNKIDIFVNSHAEALAWGVRYLPVSVAE